MQSLNPELHPDLLRKHDIRYDGEVLLEYRGRNEKITQISEANVSNAIQRLLRQGERWLVFLQGHGERNPTVKQITTTACLRPSLPARAIPSKT